MATLITLLQLLLVWVAAYLMGLAVVKALVPEDLEKAYGTLITPTVGYLTFCLASFSISASFKLPATTSAWIVMAMLGAAGLASQLRPAWRIRPRELARDLRLALILMVPMAVVTLWPLLLLGADTYLGAVNPDFFAGLMDDEYLVTGASVTTFGSITSDSSYPFEYSAGHIAPSARFGAGMFGIAIHLLLALDLRTSLGLAIGFFMLSLPLTLYFMCRAVLLFDERAARFSAWLIGASAPVGMSYLYFYLGQNSGLPALPLAMAAGFLMLVRPGWRTLTFCALVSNALFVNYFAMLPYALAPAGALGLYLVATRRMGLVRAIGLAAGFLAISLAMKIGNVTDTMTAMRGWANVIGQTLQGQFFLDFLTEAFIPYFAGVFNYPTSPWLVQVLSPVPAKFTALALGAMVLVAYAGFVRLWAKEHPDNTRRVFVISALAIYAVVWYRYTFVQQYGYAVFKMSSWLQFVLVPFMAYGICALPRLRAAAPRMGWIRTATVGAAAICAAYVTLNLVASFVYARNGLGTNTRNGYIVNHFGMSGNPDYKEVHDAVARFVKPDESVGLIFPDSIRNFWMTYYLRGVRQSILSHEMMPGDDENLPDVQTNAYVDYYGNVRPATGAFLNGGMRDQFYLTWGKGDLNQDIATIGEGAKPIWENRSFRLYRASDLHDILFTGKGFYRIEYFEPISAYFFPRVMRWSADGGEFYVLRPAHPGEPYRLSLDAVVGYRYPSDTRTFEIWHDGKKIQELSIHHSARVVTEPFYPTAGLNKIVVRIKERNKPLPRSIRLWNLDIPEDYRRMNVAFSNVSVVAPDGKLAARPQPLGRPIPYMQLHQSLARFNGLELDGWVDTSMSFTIALPPGAKSITVAGLLPGNLGFTFPFLMTAVVNGRESRHLLRENGDFTLEFALDPNRASAEVALEASQTHALGEEDIRHKVVSRSWKFNSVTVR